MYDTIDTREIYARVHFSDPEHEAFLHHISTKLIEQEGEPEVMDPDIAALFVSTRSPESATSVIDKLWGTTTYGTVNSPSFGSLMNAAFGSLMPPGSPPAQPGTPGSPNTAVHHHVWNHIPGGYWCEGCNAKMPND